MVVNGLGMSKILVIEDDKALRERTCTILEIASYAVIRAKNGQEGVDVAIAERPDLILCDIKMPLLDGYEVFQALSKVSTTKAIPFIFMSLLAERHEIRKGMDMGADDYLTKPFSDIQLLKAVEARLARVRGKRG